MTEWTFRTIDVDRDRDTVIQFRRDSFITSFGSDENFGYEEAYLGWLEAKAESFPEGFVIVEAANGAPVGQMEMQVVEYEGEAIGYVNLFYLVPDVRGQGLGEQLMRYAEAFFQQEKVSTFHLRVAPNNHGAIRFYEKHGMHKLKDEYLNQTVWRMTKRLDD